MSKAMQSFVLDLKMGDEVEWTSQSAGISTTKRGKVEKVVRAGVTPPKLSKNANPGRYRDHDSYLIRVKGKGLYWPRISLLKVIKESCHGCCGTGVIHAGTHSERGTLCICQLKKEAK
jgi:hypothetical protein